jgi:hypothetical protein
MGGTGWITHNERLSRNEHEPFTAHLEGLRDTLDSILSRHGGDFNGARFTGDTLIAIRAYRGNNHNRTTHTHELFLADCPSVADMVDPDVYSYDGEDE